MLNPCRTRRLLATAVAGLAVPLLAAGAITFALARDTASDGAAGAPTCGTQDGVPLVPPAPYPGTPTGADAAWHGTPSLWTRLRLDADGTAGMVLSDKLFWWSEDFDIGKERQPELRVTARKADGTGTVVTASAATHGWAGDGPFMLVGIDLPSAGCWQITGEYRGATTSYLVAAGT